MNEQDPKPLTTDTLKVLIEKLKESAIKPDADWNIFMKYALPPQTYVTYMYPGDEKKTVGWKNYFKPVFTNEFYGSSIFEEVSKHPHVGCIKCQEEHEANRNQLIMWLLDNKNFVSEQDVAKALMKAFKVIKRGE